MSLKLPSDFAKKIAETFNWKATAVEDTFDFSEDKDGFFWARLKPKKFLDKPDFKTLCTLTKDLGGEGYLQGARAWKIPGPFAKKNTTPQAAALPASIKAVGQSTAQGNQVFMPSTLPLTALVHMPFRSRVNIDGPDFEELVESVKELGVLEPLIVRFLKTGFYEIVAGERRFRAAEHLKLTSVPCVIRPLTDEQAYEVQLIENIQRKDLSDMEKARMLDYMIKNFHCTQDQLAKKLAKTQDWISRHLSLLRLSGIMPRGIMETGEITERQDREILAAPEVKQQEIINEINKTGEVPSAREIHSIVHPEEAPPVKPQDMTVGKARELLDTPAGKEVLEDAIKERTGKETSESEDEEPLYAEEIKTVPEASKESIPSPTAKTRLKSEEIDTGFVWECPECQQKFGLIHVKGADGKIDHRLEARY
jgi:ParB family chromosome partitioning protein